MNLLILCLLFTVVTANKPFDPQLDSHWENFKTAFKKNYNNREELARRLIWEQKIDYIVKHNLKADMGAYKFTLGLNEYSDLSHDEFVQQLNKYKRNIHRSLNGSTWLEPAKFQLPDSVDWRNKGLVTPVKNQLLCGSCWAFSAAGSLEGQHAKKTGQLVSLSAQNLVDCSRPQGNDGCGGGNMDNAFEYVKENNGIDTEASYPYTGEDLRVCHFNRSNVGATCTGFVNLPSGDEQALKKAVATVGPISVAIDASHQSFQLYRSGIYVESECNPELLDHGVLVVGYGTEDGTDYWLVKNCWGTTWGINGYIKMSRNNGNQCGIATHANYPLV